MSTDAPGGYLIPVNLETVGMAQIRSDYIRGRIDVEEFEQRIADAIQAIVQRKGWGSL